MADGQSTGSTARQTGARMHAEVARGTAGAGRVLGSYAMSSPITALLVKMFGTQDGRVATRDFVEGAATGNPNKPAPRVAPKPAVTNPVSAALAQGKAAPPPTISPYDRQLAFLDSVFQQPLTLRQASMASGMLPATGKPPSAGDMIKGQAAQLSQLIFQHQLDEAKGDDTKTAAAMDAEYQRRIGIIGANPLNAALAGSIAEGDQ